MNIQVPAVPGRYNVCCCIEQSMNFRVKDNSRGKTFYLKNIPPTITVTNLRFAISKCLVAHETSISIQYLRAFPHAKILPKYSRLSLEELGVESGTLIINYPKVSNISDILGSLKIALNFSTRMWIVRYTKKCTQHSSPTKKLQIVLLLFGEGFTTLDSFVQTYLRQCIAFV